MNKEFIEPEENEIDSESSFTEILDDFNPLDEAIKEKEYTKPNVRFDAKDMTNDISEPSFMPPPLGGMALNENAKPKKPQEPFNSEMKDLPKKDKHDAADKVAKMIMSGYSWLNDIADKQLLFNEKKILTMQQNGELDLSIEVPISPTENISAKEFIEEYNEQSQGTIKVSPQFDEEVTPVLTRVLEKKGVGMTDEQYLIYLFGKDIVIKGFMIQQSLSVKKEMLNMLKESTEAIRNYKSSNETKSEPYEKSTPIHIPTPPPVEQNTESEYINTVTEIVEPLNVNDFVNEMVGAKPKSNNSSNIKIIPKTTLSEKGKRGRPKKK